MNVDSRPSRQTASVSEQSLELRAAAERLDQWFAECPKAAVAFSGGVDSSLVAYWARRQLGSTRVSAWIGDSPSLKRDDLDTARRFCAQQDITLRELATDELGNPAYARNPVDRCFHCKSTLYSRLAEALSREGDEEVWICSGANLDDRGDYRPGMEAAARAKIRHPLLECGIGKTMIRALARAEGLHVWDKPASPCLSSRIPYGQPVTREKLAQIEAAENWLNARGFEVCRVRHFGVSARVEVPVPRRADLTHIFAEFSQACAQFGFENVDLDPEGFVSGKLNRGFSRAVTDVSE